MPVASVLAICAAVCIGFGDAHRWGRYALVALALVAAGTVFTWIASRPGTRRRCAVLG